MSGLLLIPTQVVLKHLVPHLLYVDRMSLYSTCKQMWQLYERERIYISHSELYEPHCVDILLIYTKEHVERARVRYTSYANYNSFIMSCGTDTGVSDALLSYMDTFFPQLRYIPMKIIQSYKRIKH